MVGQSISHYRILEKLGEGGMGAGYKARDSRLNRLVALKVMQSDKVADPDRKKRFVQEARAASALNHPNIITIHDIAAEDGVDFIVMEYVSGKTLDQAIGRKGFPLGKALQYAIQIADALAAAHAAGIIHRDLKRANLMLSGEGSVKVLDFGLAKLMETRSEPTGSTETATFVDDPVVTQEGTIVGTTAYMSPEQVEGRRLDARSDIFSFGAVLYEMTTGRRAFHRETMVSTLSAVLREEPQAASEIVEGFPRELERVIARCLRKNPAQRFQHIGDVKIALEELKEELDSGRLASIQSATPPAGPRVSGLRRWIWAATSLALVGAAGTAIWLWWPRSEPPAAALTAVPLTTYPGHEAYPSLSPDGNQVAFAWNGEQQDNFDIYVKLIGPGAPLRLTSDSAADTSPAWSPDGRWIAFVRLLPKERGALTLIPALGGPERKLGEIAATSFIVGSNLGNAAAWSPDGSSLIVTDKPSPAESGGLFAFSVATGERRRLTSLPPKAWVDIGPALSPDSRSLAFTRFVSFGISDVYLLPLSDGLQPIGEPKRLTNQNRYTIAPVWTPNGREIIFSSGSLTGSAVSLFAVDASGLGKDSQPRRLTSIGENAAYAAISRPARGGASRPGWQGKPGRSQECSVYFLDPA